MDYMVVNDLPIWGKFTVMDVATKKVLHEYDGEGHGDYPYDIATMKVIGVYASDDKLIVEVSK